MEAVRRGVPRLLAARTAAVAVAAASAVVVVVSLVVPLTTGGAPAGAAPARGASPRQPLRVVTSVSPITNIAANVGGDRVSIRGIVPEGVNSHTFEPAPSVARALAEADVLYLNGLQLEEPLRKLAMANVRSPSVVVELGRRTIGKADEIYDFSFPRAGGKPNPHLWTNPAYGKRYGALIRDDLSRRDPANRAYYEANYAVFAARVDRLIDATKTASATVPAERRRLLTYHDSFPYFARAYGWKVVGAIQPADFAEPTPKEVVALIKQIRRENVPAIFGSEVFPSPVLEQIGRETGVRYVDELRDDDLPGRPGEREHSWIGLLRADFRTIVEALGGNAAALATIDVTNVVTDRAHYAQ